MKMRSGPKVSGRSRQVAADQGWSLRGVPLYLHPSFAIVQLLTDDPNLILNQEEFLPFQQWH